jgi:hypothetical protein
MKFLSRESIVCVGKWCKEPVKYIGKNTDRQEQVDLPR